MSENPLSPHIQIYNWHISSLVSISHRISGVINYLFFIFLSIWVIFSFLLGQHYDLFNNFYNSFFGKFFVISIIWSFTFQTTQNSKLDAVKRMSKKREARILRLVIWMNLSFLVCWLPYATIALCYIFGKELPTVVIALPLMAAKSSVCWNPILYIAMNRQVYI